MEDKEIKTLVNLPMPRKQLVLRIKSICSKQVKNVVQQNSNKYHIYYRCKQTASYLEQLDDLDLSRIEFPQKDENGNFRLQTVRADDHYLDKYRKFSLGQINQVLLRNRQQLQRVRETAIAACLFSEHSGDNAIAAVVLDSTLSLIHLPVPGHETYKVTLNV